MGIFVGRAFRAAYADPSKEIHVCFGSISPSLGMRRPMAVIYSGEGKSLSSYVGKSVDSRNFDEVGGLVPSAVGHFESEAVRKGLVGEDVVMRMDGSRIDIGVLAS